MTSWADEVDTAAGTMMHTREYGICNNVYIPTNVLLAPDHDFVAVAQQENAADVPKPNSQPREPPVSAAQSSAFTSGPPFTVYVGNVPYDTAETNLHRFFDPAKVSWRGCGCVDVWRCT